MHTQHICLSMVAQASGLYMTVNYLYVITL